MQIQKKRGDNALPLKKKMPQIKCVKTVLHIDFHVKYTLLLWF